MSDPIRAPESEECHCGCHRPFALVLHPLPCCSPCPRCGRNIARGFITKHLEHCPELWSTTDEPAPEHGRATVRLRGAPVATVPPLRRSQKGWF